MEKNNFNNYNQKNINDTPLTDVDYAGVIYESTAPQNNIYQKHPKIKKTKIKQSSSKKFIKNKDFKYSYFLTGTISLGIVICFVVIFLTYNVLSDSFSFSNINIGNNSNLPDLSNNNLSALEKIEESSKLTANGIIKNVYSDINAIQLLNISSNKEYILKTTSSSELKDQYNLPLSLIEFSTGDAVNITFNSSNEIIYMEKSSDCFSVENISDYVLDISSNLLKVNNKTYSLNENLLIYKDLSKISLEDINTAEDILNIRGVDNTIHYIEIKKVTGSIKFINIPELTNPTLEIDRDTFKSYIPNEPINLSASTHKIVIKANNISSFVKEIDVVLGQETEIDLSELQLKKASFLIKTNVSDYKLYINNIEETSREPLSLEYGVYTIRIEKEGYTSAETQVSLNKSQATVQLDLERIEKSGNLTISSSPSEAEVYIDNIFVGYTPITYKLAYGTHNVILKKEGYLDFNLSSVNIDENGASFNITMHQNTSTTTTEETTFDSVISE